MEGRGHMHNSAKRDRNLLFTSLLNLAITFAEILGGVLSNSLSLLSDALHNFSDAVAVFIAYIAGRISKKSSTPQKTFGYKRVEILAALFNAVVLIAICIYLFYEAVIRFGHPQEVKGSIMFWVASIGLIANLTGVILLRNDAGTNLNIRAAYLHLLGDTFSSVLVIISGIVIIFKKIYWLDPLITILIGLYIMKETYHILKQTVNILMQSAPDNINITEIKKDIETLHEVENVHHVHIWCLNDSQVHFEGHIDLCEDISISKTENIRNTIKTILYEKYHISHSTLQFEYNCDCDRQLIINKGRSKRGWK